MSDDERQAFAVPFAEGEYDDVELSLLDRDDEDDRRLLILAEAMCDSNAHLGGMSRIRRHGRSQAGYLTRLSEAYGWEWTRVFLTFNGSLRDWFGVPWWPQYVNLLDPSEEVGAALLLEPEALGDDDLAWVILAKYHVDRTQIRKDWQEAGSPRWTPSSQ